jgi:hypothetical protein
LQELKINKILGDNTIMKKSKITIATFFLVAVFRVCIGGGGLIFTNCATPEIENKPISTDPILDRENSVFDFESLIYANLTKN